MKKVLYMAMSLDWYISDRNNKTPWSDFEWENYKSKVIEFWNIVIGFNTYNEMKKFDEFAKIWNPKVFVFTNKDIKDYWNFIFVKNYIDLENRIKNFSFDKILIAGWAKLNKYFLENNLINEIFLDIEPFIFWWWLKLFDNISSNIDLELLEIKKYWKNSMQVHYKVIK